MASKIINMADKLQDDVDRHLEALFKSNPLPDNGFSAAVMSRVRRQMWVRRYSLPVAFLFGLVISAKPLLELLNLLARVAASLPFDALKLDQVPINGLPQASTLIMGVLLLGAAMLLGRILDET